MMCRVIVEMCKVTGDNDQIMLRGENIYMGQKDQHGQNPSYLAFFYFRDRVGTDMEFH